MKWKTKKTTWVFLYIKYSKFWSISLENFVERKPLISEEWVQDVGKNSRDIWSSCFLGLDNTQSKTKRQDSYQQAIGGSNSKNKK